MCVWGFVLLRFHEVWSGSGGGLGAWVDGGCVSVGGALSGTMFLLGCVPSVCLHSVCAVL